MGEWPDGWFRGPGSDDSAPADASADPAADKTVSIPANQYAGRVGGSAPGRPAPPGSWPAQPPLRTGGAADHGVRYDTGDTAHGNGGSGAGGLTSPAYSPAGPGRGSLGPPRWRRWLRPKRIVGVLAVLVALLLVAGIGTYFYFNSKLTRSNILVNYVGRPDPGSGTNWLIAGSNAPQGLSPRMQRRLSLGSDSADGSDTIMVLHIPTSGRPLLISIPRDSYVHIPGYGWNKINAAFAFGGPALLARTVQSDTGLYINHFMDIGFGGFFRVVNALGGVRMCLVHRLRDRASGLRLSKGCHVLNGAEALAYVRDRHNFVTQDLQRIQDQRIFLSALLKKVTSLGVILNPFVALPAASGVVDSLTVDKGTSLYQLIRVAESMRNPLTTTVPIANANYFTSAGDAVQWNASWARELFRDLQTGQAVPKYLITGSQQGT
jgi:LCP family protein required for cell wall assembly